MRALVGSAFALAFAIAHSCLSMPSGGDAGASSEDATTTARDAGRDASAPELCVSGTSACSFARGARWTGSVCCVAGATDCVTGTADRCGDAADESWTGSVCCVRGATQCVSATPESCASSGGAWTGSVCCG